MKPLTLNVREVQKGMCIVSIGSAMVPLQSSDGFFRKWEQLGNDPLLVAARKKEYEAAIPKPRLHLRAIKLDEASLRLIGFTDDQIRGLASH